jgi:2-oxo-3-hexenedioate decarboxylase
MAMDKKTIDQLAEHLENCQLHAKDTLKITDDHPEMDWKDAYDIQDEVLARKLRRGARVVGFKAGLTSHAKMKQMNVDSPVFGFLVDEFSVPEGGEVKVSELIHPKVEAEICFITKHELRGPGCNIASVLAASDVVLPGIEVIDSRYRDFKFDLKSVVADNTSASRFVVGGQIADARSVDLRTLGVVFEINGEAVALGAGAAVLVVAPALQSQ